MSVHCFLLLCGNVIQFLIINHVEYSLSHIHNLQMDMIDSWVVSVRHNGWFSNSFLPFLHKHKAHLITIHINHKLSLLWWKCPEPGTSFHSGILLPLTITFKSFHLSLVILFIQRWSFQRTKLGYYRISSFLLFFNLNNVCYTTIHLYFHLLAYMCLY